MTEAPRITRLEDGTPFQPLYDDVYCSRSGSAQSRDVFVRGTGLPELLSRPGETVVVETGFGLGLNCAAALDALGDAHPQARLRYVSIELHPATAADLAAVHADLGLDSEGARVVRALYTDLLTAGAAERERARIEFVRGDGAAALGTLDLFADALFLDGFNPAKNPGLWNADVYAELARLARPGARLATYTVARAVRDGLEAAGFDVERLEGYGNKRHRLVGVRRAKDGPAPKSVRNDDEA